MQAGDLLGLEDEEIVLPWETNIVRETKMDSQEMTRRLRSRMIDGPKIAAATSHRR